MIAIIKSTLKTAFILCLAVFTTLNANADVSFNSTRITAADVLATGEFYKTAFGMHEVNRLNLQGGAIELFLNFGANQEAARANADAQLVIMQRAADAPDDNTAHVIFDVTDMQATVAALKAAGGSVEREPFQFGDTGIWIGLAIDPAGNHLELLQQP